MQHGVPDRNAANKLLAVATSDEADGEGELFVRQNAEGDLHVEATRRRGGERLTQNSADRSGGGNLQTCGAVKDDVGVEADVDVVRTEGAPAGDLRRIEGRRRDVLTIRILVRFRGGLAGLLKEARARSDAEEVLLFDALIGGRRGGVRFVDGGGDEVGLFKISVAQFVRDSAFGDERAIDKVFDGALESPAFAAV